MRTSTRRGVDQKGSAFVISILVLFVLSVLGMALMLTTTTETDISVNYRWGEMAFFNADAALEYGKNVLAAHAVRDVDLARILPPARADVTVGPGAAWGAALPEASPCGDPRSNPGCRDYQYYIDEGPDALGTYKRVYIGRVLRDLAGRAVQFDFRAPVAGDTRGDVDNDGIVDLQETVTLWVRRPIVGNQDSPLNDRAILTAEGTAPNYEFAAGTGRAGSLRRIEMTVSVGAGSGIAGDRYSDPTKGSEVGAGTVTRWRTVHRGQ